MKTLIDCSAILLQNGQNLNFQLKIVKNYLAHLQHFDGRNIYDREMKESGFDYFCIGIDTKKIK
jgi:UDPglucose 6-dehydrogenase